MNNLRPAGRSMRAAQCKHAPAFRLKPLAGALAHLFALAAVCGPLPAVHAAGAAPTPGTRISPVAMPSGPAGQPTVNTINGRTILAPQMVSGSFGTDSAGTNRYVVIQNSDGSVAGTITQTSNAGILQWQTFDIGANSTINIKQPSSTAVLLNKISDGDYNHSTLIEGKLNANGQVYLYNPNGIIFGKSSTVSVNSLVAASLKISDSRFLAGLLSDNNSATFVADPSVSYAYTDANGNLGTIPGNVVIEGDANGQASLSADNGGRILLVAPTIVNNGALSAPDGQVLMAAGRTVYLSKPSDTLMRGLNVGVNNGSVSAGTSVATNDEYGKINVGTGNATLIAKAVNQMGSISATTSVTENGSIYLIARDGAKSGSGFLKFNTATTSIQDTTYSFYGNDYGGDLVLGANSVTAITPTLDDKTTTSASFSPSLIYASGKTVRLAGNDGAGHPGAQIVAPAGDVVVNAIATSNADGNPTTNQKGSGASINIGSGAVIDVSGTTSTELPMESNVIAVELRGNELADNTLLRNSAIRGKTAYVDIRKGNLKIADISGWLDLVEHNVGQATARGGTVSLKADDAVVVDAGAKIDVSGGYVTYLPGYVLTSQLLWNGRLFDISSAPADRVYSGITTAVAGPRTFEAGYVQGSDAGTIAIDASSITLDGSLNASTTAGTQQRDVASRPLGGQLQIGSYDSSSGNYGLFSDAITLGAGTSGLVLDTDALTTSGFSRLALYTGGGDITINRALQLAPGASLTLRADNIDIAADVTSPDGSLSITADHALSVGAGVALNVAGTWTNDQVFAPSEVDVAGSHTTSVITNGGSIALTGGSVAFGANATLDASGGAWLSSTGALTSGSGGSISVSSSTVAGTGGLTLGDGVAFSAYGVSSGGKLVLSAGNVAIGGSAADTLTLDPSLFQTGGFASYDVRAAGNLTIFSDTTIAPRTDNWTLTRTTKTTTSGAMSDAFAITTLPLAGSKTTRNAANLSLTALAINDDSFGRLDFQAGAGIVADPGATVALKAGRQLTVDGTIQAPGGTIDLTLTPALTDLGGISYFADRSIWVGATAVLDASGSAARLWQDNTGLTQGSVLDGGTIDIGYLASGSSTLAAAAGYVVIEQGAMLDVSGTSATMTLSVSTRGGRSTRTIASGGGTIDIRAREGLVVEGTLSGAGGNASATGGSLILALDREATAGTAAYPTAARTLTVSTDESRFPVLPGANLALTGWEGQGYVTAATINNGGFDWVTLKSQNILNFDLGAGNLALHARAGFTLDAPTIAATQAAANASVSIAAPYVELGNSDWRYQPSLSVVPAAVGSTSGNVALNITAGTVDLIGNSALSGFDAASISADGDIRLVGVVAADLSSGPATSTLPVLTATGSFAVAGGLTLTSAQAYPTSLSQFDLSATDLSFIGNGNTASVPLSAGGLLTVNAARIVQDGTVRAPLGEIVFDATDTLSYGAGSLTSVATSATVPLGFVQNGLDWLYDFGNGNTINLSDSTASNYYALPDKSILSHAPTVNFAKGAVQDLSGGGDLYAYEFTPGPGGSKDVLATTNSNSTATVFAILPGYSSAVAPLDYQYENSGGLKVGDRIYLSGIPGLAAGYYTLLPAHYALLAGAYSVTAVAGTTDMASIANVAKLTGGWLVAGYRASLGGGADNRWSGYLVKSATVVRNQSEFDDYSGNTFLTSLASAPIDGGHVVFDVTRSLTLDGRIELTGAAKGKNGIADISAPEIAIVASADAPLPDGADADALKLTAADLNAIGADSLLIGGVRTVGSDTDAISVGATTVIMGSDASHPTTLTGPELILAATDTVQINAGSTLKASGTLERTPRALQVSNASAPGAGADGALLRVSNGAAVTLDRNYTSSSDGSVLAPAGSTGSLNIASGATIIAAGSALLDATRSTTLAGSLDLAQGAALGLGASRISLGSDAPANVDGLRFDAAALANLSSLSTLALTSYSSFDLYGTVDLGSTAMQTLSFTGGGMRGMGTDPVNASFTAQTIRFAQAGTDAGGGAAGASASFSATNIEIGSGSVGLHFASTRLSASNDLRATGSGGALVADGDMTLAAARITTDTGADASFTAGGTLTLTQSTGAVGDLAAAQLGGTLNFKGNTVVSDANIVARSGSIGITGSNGVQITGGTLDAGGGSVAYGSTVVHTAAGSISLDGGSGDVAVNSGATLDVSATGADAGTIKVAATAGKATLDGTFKGGTSDIANDLGGSFVLDVGSMNGDSSLGAITAKLNDGGFTAARSLRVRNGDIVLLASDAAVTAHSVTLSADNGNLDIAGVIDASGAKGGSIALYAGEATAGAGLGNVHLESTAQLLAYATTSATSAAGSMGDGGSIVLGSSTADGSAPATTSGDASLQIDSGAQLNVSGMGAGQGGTVLLRAPRLASNADVAIARLDASAITGSRSTMIEADKVYSGYSSISANADNATNLKVANADGSAATTAKLYAETAAFMNNAATITTRLGLSDASVVLAPGVEVRSDGDLTVSVNETSSSKGNRGWNLDTWRFSYTAANGSTVTAPGVLTLRAAGDLVIKGSISDGFTKTSASVAMPDWLVDTSGNASWSYRLIGGADQAAANPLAILPNQGSVKLTFARTQNSSTDLPVATVRTGTGNIDVAAGTDVLLDTLDVTTRTVLGGDFSTIALTDTLTGATLYTAGATTSLSSSITNADNALYGSTTKTTGAAFTNDGGSITVTAHDNVVGPVTNQLIDNWLFRQGRSYVDSSGNTVFDTRGAAIQNTAFWSRFDYFDQGIATFGGGDITIVAETGDVSDVSASVAANGQYVRNGSDCGKSCISMAAYTWVEQGGGDLSVKAGSDIRGGSFYVQQGEARLSATGSIVRGDHAVQNDGAQTVYLAPVLAAGDASFQVTAGKDLTISGIINPTLTAQSSKNTTQSVPIDVADTNTYANQSSSYLSYSADASATLTAIAGDLTIDSDTAALYNAGGTSLLTPVFSNSTTSQSYSSQSYYSLMPGTVRAYALGGNLTINNGFALAPSANGQLELLARDNVLFQGPVVMLDIDPAAASNALNPWYGPALGALAIAITAQKPAGTALHSSASGGLHAADTQPVRVIALDGDIQSFNPSTSLAALVMPKRAEISAGRDIVDFGFYIQQLSATDVSTITAGRDFKDSTLVAGGNTTSQIIAGPGRIDFVAGRNFDLGNGGGVVTNGNLDNPYLPEQGAGITITAGASADYANFAKTYVASLSDLSAASQALLLADMQQFQPALKDTASAWAAFGALPNSNRTAILDDLFYEKIAEVTGAKGGGSLDLNTFDEVIASLFPTSGRSGGNIDVYGSTLKTERGGAITVFAPAGSVYAGLTSIPAYLQSKKASDLGIFTIGGGAIDALVKTDFSVNLGRVFTLGGGDITLVSQYGNIDAGKGAKTSQATPAPVITTDANGNTEVDISGSISGSGIATLRTAADVPAANVYPIAPRGIFDAGDAGVRSTGSVTIVAQTVLNAGNISAAGSITGAHTADTSGLSTAAAAPSAPPPTRTSDLAAAMASDAVAGSLNVELLGYGADGQQPVTQDGQNDPCADATDDARKKKRSSSSASCPK